MVLASSALALSSCAARRPAWVDGALPAGHPRGEALTAVGTATGDTPSAASHDADLRARAGIVEQIRVEVTAMLRTQAHAGRGAAAEWTETDESVLSVAHERLSALRIAERWSDAGGQAFSLAVLERGPALQALAAQAESLQAALASRRAERARALREGDLAGALRLLQGEHRAALALGDLSLVAGVLQSPAHSSTLPPAPSPEEPLREVRALLRAIRLEKVAGDGQQVSPDRTPQPLRVRATLALPGAEPLRLRNLRLSVLGAEEAVAVAEPPRTDDRGEAECRLLRVSAGPEGKLAVRARLSLGELLEAAQPHPAFDEALLAAPPEVTFQLLRAARAPSRLRLVIGGAAGEAFAQALLQRLAAAGVAAEREEGDGARLLAEARAGRVPRAGALLLAGAVSLVALPAAAGLSVAEVRGELWALRPASGEVLVRIPLAVRSTGETQEAAQARAISSAAQSVSPVLAVRLGAF